MPEPLLVEVLHVDTYAGLPAVATVKAAGSTAMLHVLDPEDVSTFQALSQCNGETFVSSAELFPYRWYQRLLERPTGPCVALERVV